MAQIVGAVQPCTCSEPGDSSRDQRLAGVWVELAACGPQFPLWGSVSACCQHADKFSVPRMPSAWLWRPGQLGSQAEQPPVCARLRSCVSLRMLTAPR